MLQCSLFFRVTFPLSLLSLFQIQFQSIESSQSFVISIYLFNRRILYEQFSYTRSIRRQKTGNNIYGDNIRCMLNKYRPIDDEDNEWSPLVATDVCAARDFFCFC